MHLLWLLQHQVYVCITLTALAQLMLACCTSACELFSSTLHLGVAESVACLHDCRRHCKPMLRALCGCVWCLCRWLLCWNTWTVARWLMCSARLAIDYANQYALAACPLEQQFTSW